ncbi:hypothetical protein J6Z19_01065 [bacterium]|nr:hypothetical protein [bacterium]
MEEEKILFYERQRLTQWWLWLIVILVQLIPMFLNFQKLYNSGLVERPEILLSTVGSSAAIFVLSLLLIYSIKLETRITEHGVYVRMFPLGFSFKFYPFSNMTAYYVRKYHPVREYGGWGYKGRFNNRSLSISGDRGLQMEFPNGNKLLVGTRRPQEIIEILKSLQSNKQ